MIKIAVVDDKQSYVTLISEYIEQFSRENGIKCEVTGYHGGGSLVSNYRCDYDVVFLDIEMPGIDGMSLAQSLREKDRELIIVFITHLMKMAVKGYEVNAFSFLVKPLSYSDFAAVMKKVCERVRSKAELKNKSIFLNVKTGIKKLIVDDIYYLESRGHYVNFHTADGTYQTLGKIGDYTAVLEPLDFCAPSKSFLVNLRYVNEIRAAEVLVAGGVATLTRSHKHEFKDKFTTYINSSRARV